MRKLLSAVALAALVCVPGALQGQVNIGAQVSWGEETDFGFGGRLTARSPWVDPAIELTLFEAGERLGGEFHASTLGKLPIMRKRSEFLRVQAHGRRFRRRNVALLVAANEGDRTRIGLTVSRKVGKAGTT